MPLAASSNQLDTSNGSNMEVDEVQKASGGGGGATASRAMGSRNITWLPRSISVSSYCITYKKSRVMYSYGYANINLNQATAITDMFTTPLALIPIDYISFCMTPSEYYHLPHCARAVAVHCTVTPLGCTAFDHGTTLSGTATSEYIPIGICSTGMNVKNYGKNIQYVTDAKEPMVPTGFKAMDMEETYKKWHIHYPNAATCTPRSISNYWVHEWNRSTNPDQNKYPYYQMHDEGVFYMADHCDTFMYNNTLGIPIISYSKNGYLTTTKKHWIPYTRKDNSVETPYMRVRSNKVPSYKTGTGDKLLGRIGLDKVDSAKIFINEVFYHQRPYATLAIPQLNPATESINFLNTCAYWKVDCSMTVTIDHSSAFTKNHAISMPAEVRFVPNESQKYTTGTTLFGCNDAGSGGLTDIIGRVHAEEGIIPQVIRKDKGKDRATKQTHISNN